MKNPLTIFLTLLFLVGTALCLNNVNKKEAVKKEVAFLTAQKQEAATALAAFKESPPPPLNENLERLARYLFIRGTKTAVTASLEESADEKKVAGVKPLTLTLSGESFAGILLLRDVFRNFPVVAEKVEMTKEGIIAQVTLYGRNPD